MDIKKKLTGLPLALDPGVDVNVAPQQPHKGTSPCLVTIFNLAAAFGYAPFSIQLNSTTGHYCIRPLSFFRRVYHAFFRFLTLKFLKSFRQNCFFAAGTLRYCSYNVNFPTYWSIQYRENYPQTRRFVIKLYSNV